MAKLHIKEECRRGKRHRHFYFEGTNKIRLVSTDLKTMKSSRRNLVYGSIEEAAKCFEKIPGHSWTDPVRISGEYYQQKSPTY